MERIQFLLHVRTVLGVAIFMKDSALASELIRLGADPSFTADEGRNSIHGQPIDGFSLSVRSGDQPLVETIFCTAYDCGFKKFQKRKNVLLESSRQLGFLGITSFLEDFIENPRGLGGSSVEDLAMKEKEDIDRKSASTKVLQGSFPSINSPYMDIYALQF